MNIDLLEKEEVMNNSSQPQTEIPKIWIWEKNRAVVKHHLIIDLLNDWGYGIFNGDLIHRGTDSILSLKSQEKVWQSIYEYYMDFDEEDFKNPLVIGLEKHEGNEDYITKSEVRNALIDYGVFSKTIYLNTFTEDNSILNNPKKSSLHTPLFRDNKDEVFTFFKNGIVRTTKENSKLETYGTIKDGYIWDSQKRSEIDNIEIIGDDEKGLFEQFVEKCMSVKNENGEWEIDEKEYEAFRTTYGYLLSNYNNNGETPAPIFVDRDSDGVNAEGGNGKSLVMKSVKHWKNTTDINGKNVNPSDKFTFSGVKLDSQFVFMDDVNVDFPFKIIYNYTTGPMEIERKNIDRFVIGEDVKPKIGVCTNYIMSDNNWSTSRRQYVVEFGSFWNQQAKEGVSVEQYLGKRLIDREFSDNDWIQFYNFGFRCIREFLSKGVVQSDKANYQRKQFISQIEGDGVSDGVVDWIENYLKTNDKVSDCVQFPKFFSDFENDFELDIVEKWNKQRIKTALWEICLQHKWEYNPHKVGKTLSSKRWKTGPKGMQVDSFKVIVK